METTQWYTETTHLHKVQDSFILMQYKAFT